MGPSPIVERSSNFSLDDSKCVPTIEKPLLMASLVHEREKKK